MTDAIAAVGALYTGLLQPDAWRHGLNALADVLHADHIIGFSELSGEAELGRRPSFWGGRLASENISEFAEFGSEFRQFTSMVKVGSAVLGETVVSVPGLFSMPIYEKAIRPAGGHFSIAARPSKSGFLVACRGYRMGHFDGRDLDNLSVILPALKGAFELKRHLSLLEDRISAFQETLDAIDGVGVFLLDGRGAIVHLNHVAERLLGASNGLYYADTIWTGLTSDDTFDLRRLIAGRAGIMCPLRRRGAQPPLMARAVPIRPMEREGWLGLETAKVALFVRDPEWAGQDQIVSIAKALGLTKMETRLVGLLSEGNSLSDVANSLSITVGNARVHLKRIFAKTNTHRQAELVRLLLSLKS